MVTKAYMFAISLMIAAPLAAAEQGQQEASQTTVSFYDLDLTDQHDADILDARIKRAAASVCPYKDAVRELVKRRIAKQCQSEVIARTTAMVAQVVKKAKDQAERRQLAAR